VHSPSLSKMELAALYRGAALLLQTSEAEGFGLPVIESLACDCPVVASDIPPLREAGGSAAEYCEVGQIGSWRETVVRLLNERANAPTRWQARKAEARRHASAFTWSRNAKLTMDVYRHVSMARNR
jgi:glycosyltransferase involved in cell wall biosynthesis